MDRPGRRPPFARESGELLVAGATRRRPDVAPGQLDPGMGLFVRRAIGKADDELGRVTLGSKQAIQDEGSEQAARLPRPDAEATRDRPAQECDRGVTISARGAEGQHDLGEGATPQDELDLHGDNPDPRQEEELGQP